MRAGGGATVVAEERSCWRVQKERATDGSVWDAGVAWSQSAVEQRVVDGGRWKAGG